MSLLMPLSRSKNQFLAAAGPGAPGEPGFGLLGWPIALGCVLMFPNTRQVSGHDFHSCQKRFKFEELQPLKKTIDIPNDLFRNLFNSCRFFRLIASC
jgi:hypothetical protein